jgi:hypothetical protein
MLCKEMNVEKTKTYLENTLNEIISKITIRKIFCKVRETIKRYYEIAYVSENFSEVDKKEYFAIEECMMTHNKKNQQVWVIGAINNHTKDFRIEATYTRYSEHLRKLVFNFISKGNIIITDGWSGYNFLNLNLDYEYIIHNHGGGDFGFGITSTSYIESLWSNIQSKIKSIYHIIPSSKFISFIRECEFRIKNKNKNYEEIINEFFSCYNCNLNLENTVVSFDSLKDSDIDKNSSSIESENSD